MSQLLRTRFRLAWAALRGRPILSGLEIRVHAGCDGISVVRGDHLHIHDCRIIGGRS